MYDSCVSSLSFLASVDHIPQSIITTYAGTGIQGSSGDDGLAIRAQLNQPYGIAVDGDENIYIADYGNHKVRLVSGAGIMTTFAGTGIAGYSGDGALAIMARLNSPWGVALDGLSGKVYITDWDNHVVRVVNSGGIISTFAGTTKGFTFGGDDALAINAQLNNPTGVAVDAVAGRVYIADSGNGVVRVVNSTGFITIFAGTPYAYQYYGFCDGVGGPATSACLISPSGVAVDPLSGKVYIADNENWVVYVVNRAGFMKAFAGRPNTYLDYTSGDGGPATNAQLSQPAGVAVDIDGNVYIEDVFNCVVRHVANRTGIITTFAGGEGNFGSSIGDGGPATSVFLHFPYGVAVDTTGRNVYIADTEVNRIRKVSNSFDYPTGQPTVRPSIPTSQPSSLPSSPTSEPTVNPSSKPSQKPSSNPSSQPSSQPSTPTGQPSVQPTGEPSIFVWHPKPEVCLVYCLQ